MGTSWLWLGDHLAVDFANTTLGAEPSKVELIGTVDDFIGWVDAEPMPLPHAVIADPDLIRVLHLRDTVSRLLRAAAIGRSLPPADVEMVNLTVVAGNVARLLADAPGQSRLHAADGVDSLLGVLAAATVDLLAREDLANIAICQAPACDQLFHRSRPNQRWCSPGCGNRARVDRHRHRQSAPDRKMGLKP